MVVWLSADCKIRIPFSESAVTILAATPGTPCIPAPTTETFAQFLSTTGSYPNSFKI